MTSDRSTRPPGFVRSAIAAASALVALLAVHVPVHAIGVDTGNPDVDLRLDLSTRYNVGVRMQERSSKVYGNVHFDESDALFDKGDVVTNRLDLLGELDLAWKKQAGLHLSAAAWYDQAYRNAKPKQNPDLAAFPGSYLYSNNEFSAYTRRFYAKSGEWLDAFAYGQAELGDVPVSLRVGRHTVYWGEALLSPFNGVSASQAPVDLGKAIANPGSSVKELFRPLNQISGTAVLTEQVSLAAQYLLGWEGHRFPEGGTYLGVLDSALYGPNSFTGLPRTQDQFPDRNRNGAWGVKLSWSAPFLDGGSLGFIYRKYDEMLPWLNTDLASYYNLSFARNVKLMGLTLSRQVGGVSLGAEVSMRKGAALNSDPDFLATSTTAVGARGDTWHLTLNALGATGTTPLWNDAAYVVELNYNRLRKVTSRPDLYRGIGPDYDTLAAAIGIRCDPAVDPTRQRCMTGSHLSLGLTFTPQWYQVRPGVDLSLPFTFSYGLKGNSALRGGGYEKQGDWSLGLQAVYAQNHSFTLKYVGYMTLMNTPAPMSPVKGLLDFTNMNGESALNDRGTLYFTYQANF